MRYIAPAPAIDELDIEALSPTQGLQSLPENRHPCLSFKIVSDSHQYANSPHAIRLLRTCSQRPGRRTAHKDHELTSSDVGHGPLPPWSDHQQPTHPSGQSAACSVSRRMASRSLGQI